MENINTPATTNPQTPAVQKPLTPEQMIALRLNSEAVRKKFEEMGNSLQFAKEVAYATQSVQKNPILLNCNPATVIASLFNVSLTGITLNPILGYAYLIPRRVSGVFECCLDVSYKGLIQILTDSGGVKNIYSHVVYEQDKFSIEYGVEPRLIHAPCLSSNKGKVTGVYGVAVLSDGSKSFDYMDVEEINYIKGRSEMGKRNAGPWTTDFNEMAKKTIIKRMFKYLPKNDKLMRVAEAIAIDNDNNGIDFAAEAKQLEAKDKNDRVAQGIADAIAKTKVKDKPEEVEEKVEQPPVGEVKVVPAEKKSRKKAEQITLEVPVPLTEEQILEHIDEMQDTQNLNAFIQDLPVESLTNRVFGKANERDAMLREREQQQS